jgi:hypothetical protein
MATQFFSIAHVSRDGRDLVILTTSHRLVFIRDFERICRGETSLLDAGQVLGLLPRDHCFYIAFEHGRVCVATVRVFPYTFSRCTYSCLCRPLYFPLSLAFFCSFMGFTSSTSEGALPMTRSKSYACDLTDRITRPAACSSPTVASTSRGTAQYVGRTSRCTKTEKAF